MILCQTKDRILAEYALCDINKPIGISEYELTRALPENLKSSLPSIEELEAELGGKEYISDEKYLQIKMRGGIDERFTVN
jgi:hypothetical protein